MAVGAESFGDLLRRLRIAAALSQEELAARAGLSARGVSDLERGIRRAPRPESLRQLTTALSLDDDDREAFIAAAHPERSEETSSRLPNTSPPLPLPATRLIGREQECTALSALLVRVDVRLVTLTGMGGAGKTHLALAVANRVRGAFAEGAAFADLAPLSDSALVLPTVANALGIRSSRGQPLLATLIAVLRDRQMLLLLDNCEQVLDAAPDIAALIAACPDLTMLATSREPLRLRGEREWPLAPLPLPDLSSLPSLQELGDVPAIALFVARAEASDPRFALGEANARAVATLCHRVDGLPLAIELAAARVRHMSPEALAVRLERRLPLLIGGARDAPARQRTLRDALAWSYDLLTAEEQAFFRRLGVFVGGWTPEAADEVANPSGDMDILAGLSSLIDKSLVRIDQRGDDVRYGMLETVREFAVEQLEQEGEHVAARKRHAAYFLTFAERGASELEGIAQRRWLGLLESEHPNFREAFETMETQDDDAAYLRLANALTLFWFFHTHAAEGLPRFERALSREQGPTAARAQALIGAGSLAYARGDYDNAEHWLKECEELCRALGEQRFLGQGLMLRGAVAEHLEDEAGAEFFFAASLALARETGNSWLIGEVLPNLSDAAYRRGELNQAEQFALEAIPVLQETGNAYMGSMNHCNLGQVALARGDIGAAADAFQTALRLADDLDSRWIVANAIACAAAVCAALGTHAEAARLLGAADAQLEVSGHPRLPQFYLVAQTLETVGGRLGEEAFRMRWNEGRILSVDHAVGIAQSVFAGATGGV